MKEKISVKRKVSISGVFWRRSLIIISILGLCLGFLLIINISQTLQERFRLIERNYIDGQKVLLKRETERISDSIQMLQNDEARMNEHSLQLRNEMVNNIRQIHFGNKGYSFVIGYDGNVIMYPDHGLIGVNLNRISNEIIQKSWHEIQQMMEKKGEGFIEYDWATNRLQKSDEKLAYIKFDPKWKWVIGSAIYLDEAQRLVDQNKSELIKKVTLRIFLVIGFIGFFILITGMSFYSVSNKIRCQLDIFLKSIKKSAKTYRPIAAELMTFDELHTLAEYLNQTNEEISVKTKVLELEVQERKRVQAELTKLSEAVTHSPAIVMITNADGIIEYVNPKFTEITGFQPEEVVGKTPAMDKSGFHQPEFYQELWKTVSQGKEWKGDFHNLKKDGTIYWEQASINSIKDPEGRITHYVKVADDITERKRLEQNLDYLAHHDNLTNLPNRLLYHDRLCTSILRAKRNKKKVAVMILDLDNFKFVNDTYGHSAGDDLLKAVVHRFMGFIREEDTASRMGGDEFCFIINDIKSREDLRTLLDRILGAFQKPFQIGDLELTITPSIGISFFPEDARDVDSLLKNADVALYRAKGIGKNNFQFYKE